jgi:hypothetical protein
VFFSRRKEMLMKSNVTIQFGVGVANGRAECLTCGCPVPVIVAPSFNWELASGQSEEGEVDLNEEITGHYCFQCGRLLSLSINQEQEAAAPQDSPLFDAARVLLEAREDQMITQVEWDHLKAAVEAAARDR